MPAYSILVNGRRRTVEVAANTPLLWVLRDDQHLQVWNVPAHPGRGASRRKGRGGLMQRRAFLHVTGTVGAGLVIGFRLPDRHGVLSFAPNAWLRIDADGTTTLTIDKSEMGEGNHTALAMLIAEELDADWT